MGNRETRGQGTDLTTKSSVTSISERALRGQQIAAPSRSSVVTSSGRSLVSQQTRSTLARSQFPARLGVKLHNAQLQQMTWNVHSEWRKRQESATECSPDAGTVGGVRAWFAREAAPMICGRVARTEGPMIRRRYCGRAVLFDERLAVAFRKHRSGEGPGAAAQPPSGAVCRGRCCCGRPSSTGNCRQLLSSAGWSADRNAGRVAAYNVTERVVMAISKQNSTFQSGDDADGPHLHSRQTLLSSFRAGGRESNRIWATKASRKFV